MFRAKAQARTAAELLLTARLDRSTASCALLTGLSRVPRDPTPTSAHPRASCERRLDAITMLVIGLTGSIATGKSTVSSLLAQPPHSLPVIDADVLARQVVAPGTPGYAAIVERFEPTTPDLFAAADADAGAAPPTHPLGRPLNRAALGRRVFGDSAAARRDRAALNGIVHPAVRRAVAAAVARAHIQRHWAVVLDVPLLFEAGWERFCGAVVVVGVRDAGVQLARLRARDAHLSEADARDRVRSQGDVRDKAARAAALGPGRGMVLWNDGDKAQLEGAVRDAVRQLRAASPPWWATLLWLCPPLAVAAAAWSCVYMAWARRRWEAKQTKERARL